MPCGLACVVVWLTSWIFSFSPPTTIDTNVTFPIVDVGYAQYHGYYGAQSNITSFLGVRYAAPPVGKLRFQAPQPPVFTSGIQSATRNPDMCLQPPFPPELPSEIPAASEDCLFLNVFVPGTIPVEPGTTGGLPVLVWIHGGGYMSGYAAEFNGTFLVADSLNTMIVVIIQYRLGAIGFLAGNEMKAHGALNAGILDQAYALQWVQDHIGKFGGDKARVTIWGESAGAGSVLQHIVANGGDTQPPLFDNAIVNSPGLAFQYHYNDTVPQSLYNKVADKAGCTSSADTFSCLQSVDAETLETANSEVAQSTLIGTFVFVPVVDGTFIVERPAVTLSKGQLNGRVLLAFSNQNEGALFVSPNLTLTVSEYISEIFPAMMPLEVEKAAAVYEGHGSAVEQAIMVTQESIVICPTYYLLEAFAGRSWKGLFAVPPAYHGSDVPYYFYNPSEPPSYNNTEFIRAFSESFISVARYGNVNVKFDPTNITPHWYKYWVGNTEMLFNRTEEGLPVVTPITTDPALLLRCLFWSSVTSSTGQ